MSQATETSPAVRMTIEDPAVGDRRQVGGAGARRRRRVLPGHPARRPGLHAPHRRRRPRRHGRAGRLLHPAQHPGEVPAARPDPAARPAGVADRHDGEHRLHQRPDDHQGRDDRRDPDQLRAGGAGLTPLQAEHRRARGRRRRHRADGLPADGARRHLQGRRQGRSEGPARPTASPRPTRARSPRRPATRSSTPDRSTPARTSRPSRCPRPTAAASRRAASARPSRARRRSPTTRPATPSRTPPPARSTSSRTPGSCRRTVKGRRSPRSGPRTSASRTSRRSSPTRRSARGFLKIFALEHRLRRPCRWHDLHPRHAARPALQRRPAQGQGLLPGAARAALRHPRLRHGAAVALDVQPGLRAGQLA